MTIAEMHVTFRELAQQMGMQTVRAILTEDIDICLNAAIVEKTKEIINSTIGPLPYNDKVSRQNVAISPINALRSLYRKATIQGSELGGAGNEVSPYKLTIDSNGIMLYTGFRVSYNDKVSRQKVAISPINALRSLYRTATIQGSTLTGTGNEVSPYSCEISSKDVMLFTGFRLSYNDITLYDCRIIENEDLGQTLRDFCNRAAKDAPICTIVGDEDSIKLNLYTGRKNMPKPTLVQYIYVVEPDKVQYDEDTPSENVDCNLPSYLHMDIIRIAVGIYLQSIGAVSNNKNDN